MKDYFKMSMEELHRKDIYEDYFFLKKQDIPTLKDLKHDKELRAINEENRQNLLWLRKTFKYYLGNKQGQINWRNSMSKGS